MASDDSKSNPGKFPQTQALLWKEKRWQPTGALPSRLSTNDKSNVPTNLKTTPKFGANNKPHNSFIEPILTDVYQITMSYAYWTQGKHLDKSCFDLFFRRSPFKGEIAVFAGLDEALRFLATFKYDDQQIEYMKNTWPHFDEKFWDCLRNLDCSGVKVYAQKEGSLVYPRVPLLRLEGPLIALQLVETTLLNIINFPTLVASMAARHRLVVGWDKKLVEFGLRRAQGADGAMSASRFSFIGGYEATSNVQAGRVFGIPVVGTHAHSFVSSFTNLGQITKTKIKTADGKEEIDLIKRTMMFRKEIGADNTNEGELTAFLAYAATFPAGFLALIDTYSTYHSGMMNFCCVALALMSAGYKVLGVRIDSGDLAEQSRAIHAYFQTMAVMYPWAAKNFADMDIVASNDIDEKALKHLHENSKCTSFGVGTNLVTCKEQPALGGVYKLVSIAGEPRIKVSQERTKMTIPGSKVAYRIYNKSGAAVMDLMTLEGEPAPSTTELIKCKDPYNPDKSIAVEAASVQPLLSCVFDGKPTDPNFPAKTVELRERCKKELIEYKKMLSLSTENRKKEKYMVCVTPKLFALMQKLIEAAEVSKRGKNVSKPKAKISSGNGAI